MEWRKPHQGVRPAHQPLRCWLCRVRAVADALQSALAGAIGMTFGEHMLSCINPALKMHQPAENRWSTRILS